MTSNGVVITIVIAILAAQTTAIVAVIGYLARRIEKIGDDLRGEIRDIRGEIRDVNGVLSIHGETLARIETAQTGHIEAFPGHHEKIR